MIRQARYLLLALLIFPFAASAGFRDGGGGDPTEATVYDIRQNILQWIQSGDAKALNFSLSNGLTYDRYAQAMVPVLVAPPSPDAVVVGFVTTAQETASTDPEQKVSVDGSAKTCRGFKSEKDNRLHMLCNSDRFPSDGAGQFRLIHHEFAGLAGVEKNVGAASDYAISDQLADFGRNVTVYKLGPRRDPNSPIAGTTDLEKLLTAYFGTTTVESRNYDSSGNALCAVYIGWGWRNLGGSRDVYVTAEVEPNISPENWDGDINHLQPENWNVAGSYSSDRRSMSYVVQGSRITFNNVEVSQSFSDRNIADGLGTLVIDKPGDQVTVTVTFPNGWQKTCAAKWIH